ncbi:hypothetical protein Tco_0879155 [Tanacetum coccineum]
MAGFGSSSGISRRALNELMDLSGKTEVPKFMSFFFLQRIAEEKAFANMLRDQVDQVRSCLDKLYVMICVMERVLGNDSLECMRERRKATWISWSIAFRFDREAFVVLMDCMKVWFVQARSEEEAFAGFLCDRCAGLRMSINKNQRLIAELEALGEQGDAVRYLDHMREIIARDSATLGFWNNYWLELMLGWV